MKPQGCHDQGKISGKCNFFQVGEKSGNFVNGQGNLERTWKVREKSGNFVDGQENLERTWKVREFCGWPRKFKKDLQSQGKVREFKNKRLWQAVFRKFIYSVQEGKVCTC